MGRHKRVPTGSGGSSVRNSEHVEEHQVNDAVIERLGLNDLVCMGCNARVDSSLDKCRKCGSKQLRRKASDFRDG